MKFLGRAGSLGSPSLKKKMAGGSTEMVCKWMLASVEEQDKVLAALENLFRILVSTEKDCGASTVAIDNKIEQAMDLVKSHLMFAVREEVEVLKEQIKELMEKNSQLEYENSILKTNASQETLQKVQQPRPQPPTSSS